MKDPRRLSRSGGISQRLLDSASLDKPSQSARIHANALAATASSFTRTNSGSRGRSGRTDSGVQRLHPAKTLATWIVVGAAASVALGLVGSKLLDSASGPSAAAPLATLSAAPIPTIPAPSLDIAAEPAAPRPSAVSSDEAREIEAARAALARGDADGAIAQLNDYESSHPNGLLKPEAMALRIQALRDGGKTIEARTLADEFRRKYPGHPLVRLTDSHVSK